MSKGLNLTDNGLFPSFGGMLANGFEIDDDPLRAVLVCQPNRNEVSTGPLDRSRSGAVEKTITARNGASLSDEQHRYGPTSLKLIRSSKQYATVAPTGEFAFGTKAFGIGGDVYLRTGDVRQVLFSSGTGEGCYQIAYRADKALEFAVVGGATYVTAATFDAGRHVHVWVSRDADGTLVIRLEGKTYLSQVGVTAALAADGSYVSLGATGLDENDCLDGYLDGWHVVTGEPGYAADFGPGLTGPNPSPEGTVFYVAIDGDDSWTGLLPEPNPGNTDGPFRTIARAQAAMRAGAIKKTFVRAGRHQLTGTINWTTQDNGVVLEAFPSEIPVISGAEALSGFVDEGNGLWSVSTTQTDMDLIVGTKRYKVAQSGVYDPSNPYKSGWFVCPTDGNTGRTTLTFAPGAVTGADLEAGVRIQVMDRERLNDYLGNIASINTGTNTITTSATMQYQARAGSTFRLLNRAAYIRNIREFGWRASDAKLVVKPENPLTFESEGVYVPRLGRMMNLTGVQNMQIRGLTFAHNQWNAVAVYLESGATGNVLDTNTFRCCGTPIKINGSNNNTFRNNRILDAAFDGIAMENQARGNLIERNSIYGVGRVYKDTRAIGGNGFHDAIIQFNDIDDCPRYGISLKDWNANNAHTGNRVEYNKITNCGHETADGGAIESLGRSNGNTRMTIKGNYISGMRGLATNSSGGWLEDYKGFGIYMDDQTNGATITQNYVQGASWAAVYLHGGDNNVVENNILIMGNETADAIRIENVPSAGAAGTPQNNVVRKNIVYGMVNVNSYYTLFTPGTFTLGPNMVHRCPAYGTPGDVVADPQFTDPAAGNWLLKQGSPAFASTFGFVELPYALMGVNGINMGQPGTVDPGPDPDPDPGPGPGPVTPVYTPTYYVDPVNGNDGSAGTSEGAAWKTMSKINATDVPPGGAILLRAGTTISGNFNVVDGGSSWSASGVVTYGKYGTGDDPIVSGSATLDQPYVRVRDIVFNGTGGNGVTISADHVEMLKCGVTNHSGIGIVISGTRDDTKILDCDIIDNGSYGICHFSRGSTNQQIRSNRIVGNGRVSTSSSSGWNGFISTGDISDNHIENNGIMGPSGLCHGLYHGNNEPGASLKIFNNRIVGNRKGAGILAKSGTEIYNNIIIGNNDAGISVGQNEGTAATFVIRDNLILNNTKDGILAHSKGAGNMLLSIYKNTVYGNGTNQVNIGSTMTSPLVVRDNIFWGASTFRSSAAQTTPTINYNLHWNPSGGITASLGGTSYNWSSWQASGRDANGLNMNPLFANVASEDFRLQANSPARNTSSTGSYIGAYPVVTTTPDPGPGTGTGYPANKGGFLVSGNQILDGAMKPVRFTGTNWNGPEWNDGGDQFGLIPGGCTSRNYKALMNDIKAAGFNLIRLPFADTTVISPRTRHSWNEGPNPEFIGKRPIDIIGMICQYARQIGLYILLDHHRNNAGSGSGTQVNFLAGDGFTLAQIIQNWQTLVTHPDIFGNPAVMGCDVHNEPNGRNFNWNLWSPAAEQICNGILAVNPNVLVFVEGNEISFSQGGEAWGWWGGNLRDWDTRPVTVTRPDKLALSSHEYGPYLVGEKWYHQNASFPQNMFGPANWSGGTGIWDFFFGYLWRAKRFPMLIGEFGAKFEQPTTQAKEFAWVRALHRYMNGELDGNGQMYLTGGEVGMSWTMWTMTPNSGDTGGIWGNDYQTIQTNRYNEYKDHLWKGAIVAPPQIDLNGNRL